MLAQTACKSNMNLDRKNIQFLADKLINFIDYREEQGEKIDPEEISDSLIRLMPCIKKVISIIYYCREEMNHITFVFVCAGRFIYAEERCFIQQIAVPKV